MLLTFTNQSEHGLTYKYLCYPVTIKQIKDNSMFKQVMFIIQKHENTNMVSISMTLMYIPQLPSHTDLSSDTHFITQFYDLYNCMAIPQNVLQNFICNFGSLCIYILTSYATLCKICENISELIILEWTLNFFKYTIWYHSI